LTRDYPITLHPNLPHAALAALLGQARLYWHASGYGENLQRSPDRAEHFGISTVEAMSAGCVPLAFNAGGQPEIIEHGKSGWLWNTLGELQTQTLQLARQPDKLSALAEQARARSRIFCDEAAFNQRVLALLGMG
jgi:glycosyltransferase involved in cell wall biosynthesis